MRRDFIQAGNHCCRVFVTVHTHPLAL